MRVFEIQNAIEAIRYKPHFTIKLAPVEGRLLDPEAGKLRVVMEFNAMLSPDNPGAIVKRTHTAELPPANMIPTEDELMRHVRNAIRIAENYENDQWLSLRGKYLFRYPSK